jgi:hypothetical protein
MVVLRTPELKYYLSHKLGGNVLLLQCTEQYCYRCTTVRTRELYQEQYKLGTRSLVDLLNAEQAIHSANSELETSNP